MILIEWPDGHGWVLWDVNRSLSWNLDLWIRHIVRLAGFEKMGDRGCICGWWEPPGYRWPAWLWRHHLRRRHECKR